MTVKSLSFSILDHIGGEDIPDGLRPLDEPRRSSFHSNHGAVGGNEGGLGHVGVAANVAEDHVVPHSQLPFKAPVQHVVLQTRIAHQRGIRQHLPGIAPGNYGEGQLFQGADLA